MSTIPETFDIEVFRTGDYGDKGSFAKDDLEQIADDYVADRHEAPVTLDHRQNGPAEGWVTQLRRVGDRLIATLDRLSPELRERLSTGSYKKRSIELYRKHPDTERPYLKAVSFLGAAAPAVRGLSDPVFADDNTSILQEPEGDDESSPVTAVSCGDSLASAAPSSALAARRRLVDARRWNPAWEANGLLAVFEHLGPGEHLERLVAALQCTPAPVTFGETEQSHSLADEPDFNGVPSPESVERHQQAVAYMAQNPTVSYVQALLATGS